MLYGWPSYAASLIAISFIIDRGSQYTSRSYRGVLDYYGIEPRVSRKGNCWDNAVMESFFGTLKAECTDRRSFATRQEAKTVIFEYMEVFYNRQRLHSSLGYVSPDHFEKEKQSATDLLVL